MGKYLLQLSEVTGPEEVGSKGWFLVRASRAGFTIPETVFVSVQAFHAFIRRRQLDEFIAELQHKLNENESQQNWEPLAARIRKAFEEAEPLEELIDELEQYRARFSWLTNHPLAVRSSGVKEDSVDHSFAGQFETLLNVEPTSRAILAAIQRVWASEWNWQNIVYHQKKELPLSNIGMGVILQRMISPSYSGVVFTMNPTGTGEKEMIIEYVEGLGEQLVSGQKTPERVVIDRTKWQPRAGSEQPLLNQYPELPRYFRDIEKEFDMFVDVEWAIENNRLFILQIRPITKLQPVSSPNYLWTGENVGEVIPDVVTPFSWSILNPIVNGAFLYFIRKSGLPVDADLQLFGLYKNKVYFNSTLFNEVLQNFYLQPEKDGQGGTRNKLSVLVKLLPRLMWVGYRILRLTRILPKEIYRTEREYHQNKTQRSSVAPQISPQESLQAMKNILEYQHFVMGLHVSCTIMGEFFYQILDKLAHSWMAAEQVIGAEAMLQGIGEAESIRSGLALRKLAGEISRYPEIKTLFLEEPPDHIEARLETVENGEQILSRLREFFAEFGHGSLHEFELFYPRWSEDPSYIFNTLRQYLELDTLPPEVTFNKAERKRRVQEAERRLTGPLKPVKKIIFGWVRRKAEFFTTHRENLKQILVREHYRLKLHLMNIARFFQSREWITQPEDIFFLTLDEIEQLLLRGKLLSGEPLTLVANRKKERETFLTFQHPKRIRQIGDQWIPEVDESRKPAVGLTGIGCSNGVVEGVARVITSEEDFSQVRQGDILVTVATNPGWTPLFVLVKGVVTEIGGALSHGAIIAREYGIPMVAGVPEATQKIRNGDWIRVDGTHGKVEILQRETEKSDG